MAKEHKVIIIPGLGDGTSQIKFVTQHWRTYGLEPVVYSIGWHDGENTFKPKLQRLEKVIDTLVNKGDTVSLVGTSAGGSAALNTFIERKDTIHRVVIICGRLRVGTQKGFCSFKTRTSSSPAFAESIKLCESRENSLTKTERAKIMTVRALFGDELVPGDTSILRGAYNISIPTFEHMFSIGMALTFFSKPIISFLKGKKR